MPSYDPVFLFIGRLFGLFGLPVGITARKFQLVYVHWTIWIAFIVLFWLVYRRAAKKNGFPRIYPVPVLILMGCYSILAGLLFFNRCGFKHYMFYWSVSQRFAAMGWSILVIAVPVSFLYVIVSICRRDFRNHLSPYLFLFFIFHTLAMCVYLLSPAVQE